LEKNEQHLITEILNSNATAFKKVYYSHYNELCNFARKYFNDRDEAEEIVQNTLVKIWEQRSKLEGVASLKSYLFSSVKNSCMNEIAHQKVVKKHADVYELELKEIELSMDDSFEMDEDDLDSRVRAAIDELPEQCGKIFRMKYIDGMKAKEIAEITSLSQRTVETHVFNGLKSLREKLKYLIVFALVISSVFH